MFPLFVFKSKSGVLGLSSRSRNPKLPDIGEEWRISNTFRERRVSSSFVQERVDNENFVELSNEEKIDRFVDNLDNEGFAMIMGLLESEGYLITHAEDRVDPTSVERNKPSK